MKNLICFLLAVAGVCGSVFGQSAYQTAGAMTASSSDCSTSGSCVIYTLPQPPAVPLVRALTVTTSGAFVADLRFEGTYDNGLTWRPVYGVAVGANTPLALTPVYGAIAAGQWSISPVGLTGLRVRCNQVISAAYGQVLISTVQ